MLTVPALGHAWGEWEEVSAATCTEKGEEKRVCKHDDSHVETREIPAKGHTPGDVKVENLKEATCDKEGSYDEVVRCTSCEKVLSSNHIVLNPIGHKWDEGTITKKPTCEDDGERIFICVNDPEHKTSEEIPAISHDWGSWTIVKEATETEEGLEKRVCKNDPDHEEVRYIPIIAHVHHLSKVEAKPATCTEDGNV